MFSEAPLRALPLPLRSPGLQSGLWVEVFEAHRSGTWMGENGPEMKIGVVRAKTTQPGASGALEERFEMFWIVH